jgi:hypothetical protein
LICLLFSVQTTERLVGAFNIVQDGPGYKVVGSGTAMPDDPSIRSLEDAREFLLRSNLRADVKFTKTTIGLGIWGKRGGSLVVARAIEWKDVEVKVSGRIRGHYVSSTAVRLPPDVNALLEDTEAKLQAEVPPDPIDPKKELSRVFKALGASIAADGPAWLIPVAQDVAAGGSQSRSIHSINLIIWVGALGTLMAFFAIGPALLLKRAMQGPKS